MKYGYCRVSTSDQTVALQVDALEAAGCDRIFADEGVSGTTAHRAALDELLEIMASGDQIVVWRLDRLGRSLPHLIELVAEFGKRGVEFSSLTEHLDTSTAGGALIFNIMASLAQFERDLTVERTKAGLAAAKARGVIVGRPRSMSYEQVQHAKQLIAGGEPKRKVARLFKVSPATLYRAI